VRGPGVFAEVALTALAACAMFAVCGFGVTRLLLPAAMRAHELLWVLPAGACSFALGLSALGYAQVPFAVNLPVVLAGFAALGVFAARREGLPRRPVLREVAWPLWIAVLVACVALIPVFRAGTPTVPGTGSDAHLAAGTAHFLRDHAPTDVAPEEPVDRVPLVWRSKPPIYYPLAAVSVVTGQETWEAFAPFGAVLFGLAALGFFLLARDGLGAGLGGAAVGMAVVGLDRVSLQVIMHPYFNQLWGFAVLPFALLLAWRTAERGMSADAPRGGRAYGLLALFMLVGAFAYPLLLPIPLLALGFLLWPQRHHLRRLWRWWLVPLVLLALVPLRGVVEKMASAVGVVADPNASLRTWGGDLLAFVPEHQFVGLPSTGWLLVLAVPLGVAIVWELRRQPRALGAALGAVLVFGIVAAAWFRPRDFGWYFHFKALAFVGPLALLIATVAVSRLTARAWLAPALLTLLVALGIEGARQETAMTYDQTPAWITGVGAATASVGPGESIRLDVDPPRQLWVAYFLADRRLCSQRPLLNTSYPHVPVSRKADFILRERAWGRPVDATGPVLWQNVHFALYRMSAAVPGPEVCSQEMIQFIDAISVTGRAS
jgi:hypothetical protein